MCCKRERRLLSEDTCTASPSCHRQLNKARSSMRNAISTVECQRRYNRLFPDPVTAGLLLETIPMLSSTSNIEPLARDICERDFRRAGIRTSLSQPTSIDTGTASRLRSKPGSSTITTSLFRMTLTRALRLIATGAPAILTITFRRCASRRKRLLHDRSHAREGGGG